MSIYGDDHVLCFICGGKTRPDVNLVLYSRKRKDDSPYYPFLEVHDPAPGAEPMADDGSIQGCIVQAYKFSKRISLKRQSEAKRSESLRFVSQLFSTVRFKSL